MKRLTVTTFVIIAAVLLGMLLIRNREPNRDIMSESVNVGLVITDTRDDGNFCQMHYEALSSLEKDLNFRIILREHVPEDESCYKTIVGLIEEEDCEIIIGASYGYTDYIQRAASEYSNVAFIHPTGVKKSHNVASFMGRMYQVRYLSGIVAGLRTETGELAYVAAYPIPEVIRGLNAFTLGVRSVRPDAVVHVKYCHTWTEEEQARQAAVELLDRYPVDVISMHTNAIAPMEVAEERGIWSVGCNGDSAEAFPNSCLTCCVWNWKREYHDQILLYRQGKFHGTSEWVDMEDGIVELSPFTSNVVYGTTDAVEAAKARLLERNYDVFYGPIRDTEGRLRVDRGESMADLELLNHFDWYVEGVHVEGE